MEEEVETTEEGIEAKVARGNCALERKHPAKVGLFWPDPRGVDVPSRVASKRRHPNRCHRGYCCVDEWHPGARLELHPSARIPGIDAGAGHHRHCHVATPCRAARLLLRERL